MTAIPAATRRGIDGLLLLFIGSGCAALVYEVVWYQSLALIVGSNAVSMAVVLATYMGGMSLGSLAYVRWRRRGAHPLNVYAVLELLIALCAALVLYVLPWAGGLYISIGGSSANGVLLRGLFCAVFLLTPLVVTVIVSFGSSTIFTLPPPDWSLRWYERLTHLRGLTSSLWTSVQIAGLSTCISMVLGLLAAIALARGRFPGRESIAAFLTSPLMLPGLVIGISLLQAFRFAGLRDVWLSLLLSHVIVTMPYTVRTLHSALTLFDFSLIDAARTLGCTPSQAITRVLLPNLAPACLTSVIFAFLASMDNYSIAIFFTNAFTKTLPIQMLQYVEERPDPTIAAISAGLVLLAIVALVIGDRLVGLRKLADF